MTRCSATPTMDLKSDLPPRPQAQERGGLTRLERLLGLRNDGVLAADAVFVSMDIEVASPVRNAMCPSSSLSSSAGKPVIEQIAFASLDPRNLRRYPRKRRNIGRMIKVQMFHVGPPGARKPSASVKKRGARCLFAASRGITQEQLSGTVRRALRIRDRSDAAVADGDALRNIVLIGHSIGNNIWMLRHLGIDVCAAAPILCTIDTHLVSRHVFLTSQQQPPTAAAEESTHRFCLRGVLAELGFRPDDASSFHNAGNDAVYSLYAMLLLAIKEGRVREPELRVSELRNLDIIDHLVSEALRGVSEPVDSAKEEESPSAVAKLGAGLQEIATMFWLRG